MKRVIETKFYTFNQNNSGGYFETDKNDGIAEYVIIEGASVREVQSKARDLFNNYSNYCECCGERWSTSWIDEDDGKDEPMIYSEPVEDFILNKEKNSWFNKSAAIHYYDGTIKWIGDDPESKRS